MLANESFGAPKEHTTNNFIEGKEIFSKVQNSHDIWQKFKHYARYSLQCQGNDIRKEYQNSPHKIFLVSLILIVRIMFLVKTTNQGL